MDRLVSVRLAKLERALHAAETRVSDLEARSRVDLNRRVSVLEAWAQSKDELDALNYAAERGDSDDRLRNELKACVDSIQAMLRRELNRE